MASRLLSVIIEITGTNSTFIPKTACTISTSRVVPGLKIAIDDFGDRLCANGERLKRLKADIIKIDGCFVKIF